MPQFLERPVFRLVGDVAEELGVRAFVIGGYVRDCLLGRECNDIDIVVEGSGIDFATAVGERSGRTVSYFRNFGTAMLRFGGDEIEFVGARRESYRRESRKPIVENGTLEDDQMRRDFTINAMALSLCKEDWGALVSRLNLEKSFLHFRPFRVPNHVADDGDIHHQGDETGHRQFGERGTLGSLGHGIHIGELQDGTHHTHQSTASDET